MTPATSSIDGVRPLNKPIVVDKVIGNSRALYIFKHQPKTPTKMKQQSSTQIRTARMAMNLTQKELAALTGISLRTIQRIENGAVSPQPYTIRKIESVLTIDAKDTDALGFQKFHILLFIQCLAFILPFACFVLSYLFWKKNDWTKHENGEIKKCVRMACVFSIIQLPVICIAMLILKSMHVQVFMGVFPTPLLVNIALVLGFVLVQWHGIYRPHLDKLYFVNQGSVSS